ncbi:MAG TPA: hypothetical protein VJB09_02765 [Candidatus Paceibacterota bacterium]
MFNFSDKAKLHQSIFGIKNIQKRGIGYTPTQTGQAMISSVIFFVFLALVIISGLASPTVREYKIVNDVLQSKRSFFAAESGIEDVYYRLLTEIPHLALGAYDLRFGADYATVQIDSMVATERTVTSTGNVNGRKRVIQFVTNYLNSVTFQNGLQFGKGGLFAQGASSWVAGGITSIGPVIGSNSNSVLSGGATSSGSAGLVQNLRFLTNTYDVHSHTIDNSIISGNAYYTSISNSTVNGISYPNSPDAPAYPLPITDTMIEKFKLLAAAGGTYAGACPYNINSGNVNLGPIKIPCNSLNISGTARVSINGPVWVTGNINISDTAVVSVGAGVGAGKSVPVIADNTLDRITSSKISINTVSSVTGFGSNSYVMLISQNNDLEKGGSQDAVSLISTGGEMSSVLVYASHGHINVQTNGSSALLQIISGYKATLSNFSSILAARPGQSTITFPDSQLNIWTYTQWKEI